MKHDDNDEDRRVEVTPRLRRVLRIGASLVLVVIVGGGLWLASRGDIVPATLFLIVQSGPVLALNWHVWFTKPLYI